MNKADLILKISEKLDVSRFDVEEIVDEFLTMIEKEIVKGEDVKLSGFGIFEKKIRKERKGTNPSDGTIITIPSKARCPNDEWSTWIQSWSLKNIFCKPGK